MSIEVRGLNKRFGATVVCDDLNLDIPSGELVALLGPSGSGKTTLLRIIAGLEVPDSGTVLFHGEDATNADVRERRVGFVFQHYALFGHMTIFENVAFGLRVRPRPLRPSEAQIRAKVMELLKLVQLDWIADRFPHQLSGGQRQRVALARALVNRPKVLLLDEPLGALDAKLRKRLQLELKALQEEVGITFIYVTHDQEEALTMSDRIAVMSQGRVEQVGPPKEIYEAPSTAYVADFLGVSNLMDAKAGGVTDGGCKVSIGDFTLVAGQGDADTAGDAKVTIRPERVVIEEQGATGQNRLPAMVERTIYVGSTLQVILHLATGQTIQAWVPNTGSDERYHSGDAVTVEFPSDSLRVLPEGGTAVLEEAELDVATDAS
jgi:spermidine/putrescine ABC transporter ATP-binding subunit